MSKVKRVFLYLFVLFYVGAGVNHFASPDTYVPMMPPYLPFHLGLIYLSGLIEIALGASILVAKLRPWAAWVTIAMLLAFMPVHVYMLMEPGLFPDIPLPVLWLRLPLQGLFILWAWWFTRPEPIASEA